MDDRPINAPSSVDPDTAGLAPGVADEVAADLAGLEPGADFTIEDATAAAVEEYAAAFETARARARESASVEVEIGGSRVVVAPADELVVGRHGEHRVDHPTVSRHHLAVTCQGPGLWVRDVGSANGSWLLRDGERIRVTLDPVHLVALDRIVTTGDIELLRVLGAS